MNKYKDKWFYFEILLGSMIIFGLVYVYLDHMINQYWLRNIDYPFSVVIFQGQFFSFFTYQSNFMVAIFLLLSGIFYKKKLAFCKSQTILLAITSYITVTCVTYTFILFPSILFSHKPIKPLDMVGGTFFHMISPPLMIFYCVKHIDLSEITKKSYFTKSFILYLIYPWLYTLFLLGRLIMYTVDFKFTDVPIEIIYPYSPFFDYNSKSLNDFMSEIINLILSVIVFFVSVHVLFITVNLIYFFSFKKMANKKALNNTLTQNENLNLKNKVVNKSKKVNTKQKQKE